MSAITEQQLQRYRANLCLEDFDIASQQLLLDARVAIVGLGGLGCAAALYLAASGVGHLDLIDFDRVDISNLQRQIAYSESDLGRPKAEAMARRLQQLNTDIELTAHRCKFQDWPAPSCDLILDCSDNLATRLQVNNHCLCSTTSLISAAALAYQAQLFVFNRQRGQSSPCYACVYRSPEEDAQSCQRTGVLSPLVGLVGSWQAALALDLLLHPERHQSAYMLSFALPHEQQRFAIRARPDCPSCALNNNRAEA